MGKLSCREFIEFLDNYLEGGQPEGVRAEFERHMDDCPYCVDYLKTFRDAIEFTRRACAADSTDSPPGDAPPELIEAILAARLKSP